MNRITPQKMSEMLREHRTEVTVLLQKYRVFQPMNVQTIQMAANRHGQRFTNELAGILSTPSNQQRMQTLAGFEGGGTSGPASGSGSDSVSGTGGNFWDNFSNLFDTAYQIYLNEKGNKSNPAGGSIQEPQPAQPETIAGIPTKTLVMILGIGLLVLILVLILKK